MEKRPPHRPTEYKDLTAFMEKTAAVIESGEAYTSETLVKALGISRMTLTNYKRRGAEWAAAIDTILKQIKSIPVEQKRQRKACRSASALQNHATGNRERTAI